MVDIRSPAAFSNKPRTTADVLRNLFPGAPTPQQHVNTTQLVQQESTLQPARQAPPVVVNVPVIEPDGSLASPHIQAEVIEGEDAQALSRVRKALQPKPKAARAPDDNKPDLIVSRKRAPAYTKAEIAELGLDQ